MGKTFLKHMLINIDRCLPYYSRACIGISSLMCTRDVAEVGRSGPK